MKLKANRGIAESPFYDPKALLSFHSRLKQEEARLPHGLAFHQGMLEPSQIVENGEIAVSILQTATQGMAQMQEHLCEAESQLLKELLEKSKKSAPNPKLALRIERVLEKIKQLAQTTTFKGQHLLDGTLGISGKGNCTTIFGGIPISKERRNASLRIEVVKMATPSTLKGNHPLTNELIRQESQIVLAENGHIAKYNISPQETVASLLEGLEALTLKNGLDLTIQMDEQGYLTIQHGQYGRSFLFSGCSQKTSIVSKQAGVFQLCRLGENCVGTIEGRPVQTRGQLLLCEEPLTGMEGLAILWQGTCPGVDQLKIKNGTLPVSMGNERPSSELWIAIEACTPESLANGVQNRSGFGALAEVKPKTWQSIYDTLYLVQLSLAELKERVRLLKTQQIQFEQTSMKALEISHQSPSIKEGREPISEKQVMNMATLLQNALAS